MILDGKKVVADHLRSHSSISSLNCRVVGKPPDDRSTPWIQVTQINATNQGATTVEHLVNYTLQFSCFVGPNDGHPVARSLAHTVRGIIAPGAPVTAGTVTFTAEPIGETELFDPDSEPAREYVALTANIYMHG
jgi:hypothetical protein